MSCTQSFFTTESWTDDQFTTQHCVFSAVITSPELRKSGNIWVMPNPDHVCTRFFFVSVSVCMKTVTTLVQSQCVVHG